MKQLIYIIILAVTLSSCGRSVKGPMVQVISGTWEQGEGRYVVLAGQEFEDSGQYLDSVRVNEGSFYFELPLERAQKGILTLGRARRSVAMDGQPVKVTVTGDPDDTETVLQITIDGSPEQEFVERTDNITMLRFFAMAFGVGPSGFEGENVTTGQFIDSNLRSQFLPYFLMDLASSYYPIESIAAHYEGMSPEVRSSYQGEMLRDIIDKKIRLSVGGEAPGIELPDPEGVLIKLTTLRGKYILLDFWASWCGPCIKEIPNLKEIYDEYSGRGFEILSISLDEDRSKWLGAIEKYDLPWLHVSSLEGWECPVAREYEVTGIPKMFLLNPEGEVIGTNLYGELLSEKIKEIFD